MLIPVFSFLISFNCSVFMNFVVRIYICYLGIFTKTCKTFKKHCCTYFLRKRTFTFGVLYLYLLTKMFWAWSLASSGSSKKENTQDLFQVSVVCDTTCLLIKYKQRLSIILYNFYINLSYCYHQLPFFLLIFSLFI